MTPLPPKQGLKLNVQTCDYRTDHQVMTPLPPKQGLKPGFLCAVLGKDDEL